jgi:hypothetical protein
MIQDAGLSLPAEHCSGIAAACWFSITIRILGACSKLLAKTGQKPCCHSLAKGGLSTVDDLAAPAQLEGGRVVFVGVGPNAIRMCAQVSHLQTVLRQIFLASHHSSLLSNSLITAGSRPTKIAEVTPVQLTSQHSASFGTSGL